MLQCSRGPLGKQLGGQGDPALPTLDLWDWVLLKLCVPDLKTKQLIEYLSTPYENEINNTKKFLIRMSDIYFVCVTVL